MSESEKTDLEYGTQFRGRSDQYTSNHDEESPPSNEEGLTTFEEHSDISGSQEITDPSRDLLAYVQRMIAAEKRYLERLQLGGAMAKPLGKAEQIANNIERFEAAQQGIIRGDYSGVAVEIEREIAAEQRAIDEYRGRLQQNLRRDAEFFALKEKIISGHRILTQLDNQDAQNWIASRIAELQEQQLQTERGGIVYQINKGVAAVRQLQLLQQAIKSR